MVTMRVVTTQTRNNDQFTHRDPGGVIADRLYRELSPVCWVLRIQRSRVRLALTRIGLEECLGVVLPVLAPPCKEECLAAALLVTVLEEACLAVALPAPPWEEQCPAVALPAPPPCQEACLAVVLTVPPWEELCLAVALTVPPWEEQCPAVVLPGTVPTCLPQLSPAAEALLDLELVILIT
jgi:hypothetical protein